MDPIGYDEAIDGNFSADRLIPPELGFGIGANVIRAAQGGADSNLASA